jgi:transcriptional regulator with XRE-family HTH domain
MKPRSTAHAAFGRAIRELREERGISQEAFALKCGVDCLLDRADRCRRPVGRPVPAARRRRADRALPGHLPAGRRASDDEPRSRGRLSPRAHRHDLSELGRQLLGSHRRDTRRSPRRDRARTTSSPHRLPPHPRACLRGRHVCIRTPAAADRVSRDDHDQLTGANGRRSHAAALARGSRHGADCATQIPTRQRCQSG